MSVTVCYLTLITIIKNILKMLYEYQYKCRCTTRYYKADGHNACGLLQFIILSGEKVKPNDDGGPSGYQQLHKMQLVRTV